MKWLPIFEKKMTFFPGLISIKCKKENDKILRYKNKNVLLITKENITKPDNQKSIEMKM